MECFEITIVGGGMAGLSAALYGGWLGRTVFLAERQMFGGHIVNADKIENYPGFPDGILGADVVSQVRIQAIKFGAKMVYIEIVAIKREDAVFRLQSTEEAYESKTLILATGGRHRTLAIKGERELDGRGVSRCATCDGAFFADKPVAVIGGGGKNPGEKAFLFKNLSGGGDLYL